MKTYGYYLYPIGIALLIALAKTNPLLIVPIVFMAVAGVLVYVGQANEKELQNYLLGIQRTTSTIQTDLDAMAAYLVNDSFYLRHAKSLKFYTERDKNERLNKKIAEEIRSRLKLGDMSIKQGSRSQRKILTHWATLY